MPVFSLKKKERLSKRGLIDSLFAEGKPFISYPLRFIFLKADEVDKSASTQVLFSVSKRKFKSAVIRNKMKRRMREAYRLNKSLLPDHTPLYIAFQFIAKEEETFAEISKGMIKGLKKLRDVNA